MIAALELGDTDPFVRAAQRRLPELSGPRRRIGA